MERSADQVRLAVFSSEPLARLAEQRLRQADIPCVVKSIGVGPGGWGAAANLPYAVYIQPADEMRARQVLELEPAEIGEREGRHLPPSRNRSYTAVAVLLVAIAAGVLILADKLFQRLFR